MAVLKSRSQACNLEALVKLLKFNEFWSSVSADKENPKQKGETPEVEKSFSLYAVMPFVFKIFDKTDEFRVSVSNFPVSIMVSDFLMKSRS